MPKTDVFGITTTRTFCRIQSNERTQLVAGHKNALSTRRLHNVYREILIPDAVEGHEWDEKPLSAYVVVRIMLNSDPMQAALLCGGLDRPSWLKYYLFEIDSTTCIPLLVSLVTIEPPPFETTQLQACKRLSISRNRLNDDNNSFSLETGYFFVLVQCSQNCRLKSQMLKGFNFRSSWKFNAKQHFFFPQQRLISCYRSFTMHKI